MDLEQQFTLLDFIEEGIMVIDSDTKIHFWNKWLATYSKKPREMVIGTHLDEQFPEIDRATLARKIRVALSVFTTTFYYNMETGWFFKIPFRRLSGSTFEYMQQNVTIYPLSREKGLAILLVQDQTALREAHQKIQRFASMKQEHQRLITDSRTGLYNRAYMLQEIKELEQPVLAILHLDILQNIYKFYGFKSGDWLLKETAGRLSAFFQDDKFGVYKLPSAEYGVLAKTGLSLEDMVSKTEEFLDHITGQEFLFDGHEFPVTFTAGLSNQKDNLLRQADLALQAALERKKAFLVFDDSMDNQKQFEENIKWLKILHDALNNDRVVAFFQPIFHNRTDTIAKYELLVRMIDAEDNVISPFFFLEVAKQAKLYHHITRIMVETAFAVLSGNSYEFSINLSVEDILDPATNKLINKKLTEDPEGSKRIVFEIIESEGIENFDEVSQFIQEVKRLGAKIAIDDFGTGYSNFDYLMRLDIDLIKIDGSLIKDLNTNRNSQMVVETVVDFAKKLDIETVAEFVDSDEVLALVKEIGVTYTQGFLLGKPAPEIHQETDRPST